MTYLLRTNKTPHYKPQVVLPSYAHGDGSKFVAMFNYMKNYVMTCEMEIRNLPGSLFSLWFC